MSAKREIAMAKYLSLVEELDAEVSRAWTLPEVRRCPPTCYDCCQSASILPVGAVEVERLVDGLEAMPEDVRDFILAKARRSANYLERHGFDAARVMATQDAAAVALEKRPEAPCPFLVAGVCAAYEHRPLICHVWGVPIHTGGEKVDCCPKTSVSKTIRIDSAISYLDYWRKAKVLSGSVEKEDKEPMAFFLLRKWNERLTTRTK